jgi:hypothetical protein
MRDVALFAGGEVPDAKITRRPVGEREIAAIRRRRTRLIGVLTGPRLANAHGGFGCPVNSQSRASFPQDRGLVGEVCDDLTERLLCLLSAA